MKQQSSRGIVGISLLFTALVMALALPLRIWQQIYLVESETGFWAVGGSRVSIALLYVAMGLLIAVPCFASLTQRRRLSIDLERRPRTGEGLAAFVAAAAITIGAASALYFSLSVFSGRAVVYGVAPDPNAMMQFYIRSGAIAALLEAFFAALSALFFVNLALADLRPEKEIYLNRLLALMPVLWMVARVLRRFSRTIAYLRVSDLFITIAALVLLLIFLLAFAQILSGINSAGREWRLAAAGIPAAALLLLGFLPRVVAYRFVDGLVPSQDAVRELADPAMALFIVVFIYGRIRQWAKAGAQQAEGKSQDSPEATTETETA